MFSTKDRIASFLKSVVAFKFVCVSCDKHRKQSSSVPKTQQRHQAHRFLPLLEPRYRTACQLKLFRKSSKKASITYKKSWILEDRLSELESQMHVTQTVNSLLELQIDSKEQYSRPPCHIINGLEEPGDED